MYFSIYVLVPIHIYLTPAVCTMLCTRNASPELNYIQSDERNQYRTKLVFLKTNCHQKVKTPKETVKQTPTCENQNQMHVL